MKLLYWGDVVRRVLQSKINKTRNETGDRSNVTSYECTSVTWINNFFNAIFTISVVYISRWASLKFLDLISTAYKIRSAVVNINAILSLST